MLLLKHFRFYHSWVALGAVLAQETRRYYRDEEGNRHASSLQILFVI